MDVNQVVIYCDGACSGNPGPGGWGSLVAYKNQVIELGGASQSTTNNRMELTAAIEALRFILDRSLLKDQSQILILTDSVYVIRGITQWIKGWKSRGWKTAEQKEVLNQDLWLQLDNLLAAIKNKNPLVDLSWNFIKGHAGFEGNERCDEIAVAFSKREGVDLYDGSVQSYIFNTFELPPIQPLPDFNKKKSEEPKKVWYISYVNGVFTQHQTWKECEALVKGRAAKFKKVSSLEEEQQIKKSWGLL
jgi:ribonuclease HI